MRQDLPFSFLILEISFTVKHFKIVQPQQCGRKALCATDIYIDPRARLYHLAAVLVA